MTATIEAAAEAVPAQAGFLDWVTRLVHTHRGRLYRAARPQGLRDEDSLDETRFTSRRTEP